MREAPPLPEAYRTLADLAEGAGDRDARIGRRARISPARGIHAVVHRALAAARSTATAITSRRIFATARRRSTFPSRESFAILEPMRARYAVFHLDLMTPRRSRVTILIPRRARTSTYGSTNSPGRAAREGRRRVALRNHRAGRASLAVRRRWRCCTRGRWRATRRAWRVSTITTPSSIPGSWRGSRTCLPRASAEPVRSADPLSRTSFARLLGAHVRAVGDGRAAAVVRRCRRCWSTTC